MSENPADVTKSEDLVTTESPRKWFTYDVFLGLVLVLVGFVLYWYSSGEWVRATISTNHGSWLSLHGGLYAERLQFIAFLVSAVGLWSALNRKPLNMLVVAVLGVLALVTLISGVRYLGDQAVALYGSRNVGADLTGDWLIRIGSGARSCLALACVPLIFAVAAGLLWLARSEDPPMEMENQ